MKFLKSIPNTFSIVFSIILISAAMTWFVPAGEFERQAVEVGGSTRTLIVEGSYHTVEQNPQTWQVFTALFNGFEKQAGIIAFILIIGGAFWILNASRSIDVGIYTFLKKVSTLERVSILKKLGVNNIVITLIMIMFSLFGAVFGMSEETLAFAILIVPLAISMGYDSLTGVAMVYVAAHIGFAGAVLNPFTIGIAQGLSNIPLFSGFEYRLFCWLVLTTLIIIFVLWWAARVKRNPQKSPTYHLDAHWRESSLNQSQEIQFEQKRSSWIVYLLVSIALVIFSIEYPSTTIAIASSSVTAPFIPISTALFVVMGAISNYKSYHFGILNLLGFTILYLILGVLGYGWYIGEISALFLSMGILSGLSASNGFDAIFKLFIEGCKDIFSAAMIVGFAGGIIFILQEGKIIDTLLNSLAGTMGELGRVGSVGSMYAIQTLINIIIPSGSAKAALTMPIMAPFSDVIGLSRQATVMAFQFGDGFTNMITPTSGVLIGVLGIARIPYGVWVKWFWKVLLLFVVIGFLLLIPTATMQLNGF